MDPPTIRRGGCDLSFNRKHDFSEHVRRVESELRPQQSALTREDLAHPTTPGSRRACGSPPGWPAPAWKTPLAFPSFPQLRLLTLYDHRCGKWGQAKSSISLP